MRARRQAVSRHQVRMIRIRLALCFASFGSVVLAGEHHLAVVDEQVRPLLALHYDWRVLLSREGVECRGLPGFRGIEQEPDWQPNLIGHRCGA